MYAPVRGNCSIDSTSSQFQKICAEPVAVNPLHHHHRLLDTVRMKAGVFVLA
jgi:hypothetical protein